MTNPAAEYHNLSFLPLLTVARPGGTGSTMTRAIASKTRAVDEFSDIVRDRHQYARDWKSRTGGKVVGYLCTYMPEEIIYAAGALPVRILGSHEPQDVVDRHIFSFFCSYCRDALAQGLQGRYSYLDGLTTAHCCIHIRQTYDSWQRHAPVPYKHYVYMPAHIQSQRAKPAFVEALRLFQTSLEEWTGVTVTSESLDRAIDIYNQNRRLLKQVYELRKGQRLPLSAAEAARMVIASQLMDKLEHNRLLEQAIKEVKRRPGNPSGVRLMVVGSEVDEVELLEMIESLGASIVVDDLCTGSRYFWNEAVVPSPLTGEGEGEGEPLRRLLSAIAQRYIDRPPCPLKDLEERRRLTHLLNLAREYAVQGVILITRKFCDPHGFDAPVIQTFLEDKDIPTLNLEVDWTIAAGQFRTRVEAFLELVRAQIT